MTLLRFGPAALARSRFAISPLAETLGALIALHRATPPPWLAGWHARHQPAYRSWLAGDEVAAGLLGLVAATKWLPDTVTPPPAGGLDTDLDDELAVVAAHPDDAVRASMADALAASWQPPAVEWLAADDLAAGVAGVLRVGWERFVAPDWPRRRAVLERDITHRVGLIGSHGWRRAVVGMTGRVTWVGRDAIWFSDQPFPDRSISDEGLVFVPYTSGGGWWTCEDPPRYALVYPARGAGAPEYRAAGAADPLATLLGPGRARVLRELARPATSTQLAGSLRVSLGTVSGHLAVLRAGGVVTGARAGRRVVYHRTAEGEALAALFGPD
ncbi:ArsR/SmtB family transcription factor [Plantactinospora sp. GCM10030261]|uniref:ArsR/SmtB family transcription factor n=1 Tax=Plantactinospora sp. GCM10030261 TaxID=3273420 RepID=UPI003610BC16